MLGLDLVSDKSENRPTGVMRRRSNLVLGDSCLRRKNEEEEVDAAASQLVKLEDELGKLPVSF
jgi:hypothetical protein